MGCSGSNAVQAVQASTPERKTEATLLQALASKLPKSENQDIFLELEAELEALEIPDEKAESSEDVTIMVYSVGGDLILGPKQYPSSITASQLKSDLARSAGNTEVSHLMIGDKILDWNDSVSTTYGQRPSERIVLNCVFCSSEVRISARFHSPYQDYTMGWSLKVEPLDQKDDVEGWLRAVNEADSTRNLENMTANQLISRLETYLAGTFPSVMSQGEVQEHIVVSGTYRDWEQFQSMMSQAGSGQVVEMARKQCGLVESMGGVSGFRAVFAGHGITFHVHSFY